MWRSRKEEEGRKEELHLKGEGTGEGVHGDMGRGQSETGQGAHRPIFGPSNEVWADAADLFLRIEELGRQKRVTVSITPL